MSVLLCDHPDSAPATYTNLAGETFTYKPGSADEWANIEIDDDAI